MPLEPLSLISTIIGFISFFIAVLTWVNVFWSAFFQLNSAPREVVDNLSSLRQRLYEERTHARRTRKRCNPTIGEKTGASHGVYWDGGPAKVMNDVVCISVLVSDLESNWIAFFIIINPIQVQHDELHLKWRLQISNITASVHGWCSTRFVNICSTLYTQLYQQDLLRIKPTNK